MQLTVEDLPKEIKKEVKKFIPKVKDYEVPELADGRCSTTTEEFKGILWHKKIKALNYSFIIPTFYRHCFSDAEAKYIEMPEPLKKIFTSQGPGSRWGGHSVLIYQDILIDFTARQFDATSPWPLIWKLNT